MTDINAKINWQPGMELTAQALREFAESLNFKQQVTSSISHHHRLGILPDVPYSCEGAFVKNVLEINHFRCMAVLPSGRIIDACDDVTVKIPLLYGEKYYLTVAFGPDEVSFGKGEVPFVRPQYVYDIHTFEELAQSDCLPIMKFIVKDGVFNIDAAYIPPQFLLETDERFAEYIHTFTERLSQITSHANLEDGDGKRCLLRYLFELKSYDLQDTTQHFMQFIQCVAHTVDYHIMQPNTESAPQIPACSRYDVSEWLEWFADYLTGAISVLNKVVLEDHSIDYEKLKQEIQADVYHRVYDEIYGQVKRDILDKFNPEMEKQIKEALTNYINHELKQDLRESLQQELSTSLHEKLYQPLYDALYNALYVPVEEEEEEEFVPQI